MKKKRFLTMKKKRFLTWFMAASMCLSAFVTPYATITANAMTTLETDVTIASEECTILGVYGSYYSQPQAALDRINEIRKEACEAGNVPDPRQPSRTLTPADYVPIKWSTDLESIARLRAAEGGLAFNFLSSGHNRLNGKGTFSISSNGISSSSENLAYNGGTSMVYGIDQWYGEKADWVGQVAGKVTGHYTSMINPNYTYVGLGDFYTEEASYPNTLAGEFCSSSQELNQTMQDELSDVMQKIEVKNSYMTDYILDGITTIYTDKTTTLTPKVNLVNGSKRHKLWVVTPITYTSSNDSVATVTADGIVTGHRNGEAVITAQSNGSVLASATITVKCDHTKELLSSTLPTCTTEGSKIYRCEICGESIEQKIPKTAHNYVYGDADSEGYRTGICSVCQDTLKIIPPTTYTLWWRSSTSDSQSYSSLFPGSNPIGSTIYCWINEVDGDENYRDMVIESSDESVVSVPETAIPNSYNNQLHVLAPGITIITIYPTYNPALKKTVTVRIGDSQSVDITTADTVLSQSSYPYTGKACTPDVSVSYHDVPLKVGKDYTIAYENNTEIGTATVIITGTGIFNGTIRKDFTITGSSTQEPEVPETKELSNCTITVSPSSYVYDGKAKTPAVTVKDGDKILTKDTDYTVSYKDNINVGTAKAVVTGEGNYKGTVTKNFTITGSSTQEPEVPETKELSNCTITVNPSSYVYDGKAKTPAVTVKDGDKILTKDTDYTVSYKDNINVGTAKAVVTGKGNYKGTVTKDFTITGSSTQEPEVPETKELSNCTITVSPSSYVYDGKAKTPAVTVKDGDKILTKGTDYMVSYEDNINVGTAKAVVTGKGNYKGTVTKNFTITESSTQEPEVPEIKELSNCTITVSPASYVYNGKAKTPAVTVKDGDKILTKDTDYTVSYKDNINVGTAKAVVTGKGNYKGKVTKFFTITIKKGTSHKVGSYQYKVTGTSTVSMTAVNGSKVKKVKVSKTVKIGGKTFKVTAIANNAFKNNKKITSVEIEDNVKTIGTSAFAGCTKITKTTLGKGVTEIGSNAFKGCKKLGTITIKSTKLKKVGKNALKGIKTTAKVKVPAKKLSAYKKLLKNKGQGKKVKVVKL